MIDISKIREEMARIHVEATAHETYAAGEGVEVKPDEQAAQDARIAQLEKYAKAIENAEKLAKFAYSGERPADVPEVKRPTVVMPTKSADEKAVEAYNAQPAKKMDREAYAAELSAWVRGDAPETYAAITTTSGSGAFLPLQVTKGINLVNVNPYRAALAAIGKSTVSYGSTAKVTNPVVTPFAGSALAEDGSSDTSADANAKLAKIVHTPSGFQSGTFWYSGLEIEALTYDITSSHLPALAAASDYAAAAAVTAAIKADAAITSANANVTTASTTTITQANIDAALNRLAMVYRAGRVLHLSPTAYALVEALADTTNKPLLTPDLQNQTLLRYRGVPVIMDPTLDATGTSTNMVGMVVSYTAFEWRDEIEKLLKYVGESANPDKTGLNHIRYCDGAYYAAAIVKIVN